MFDRMSRNPRKPCRSRHRGALAIAASHWRPVIGGWSFLFGLKPALCSANPVNPGGEALGLVGIGLTGIALAVEVALTAALLILICRVEHRARVVAGLVGNLASFFIGEAIWGYEVPSMTL